MRLSVRRLRRAVAAAPLLFSAYAGLAYVAVPAAWSRHQRRIVRVQDGRISYTAERIPGDPLNVALVGSRPEVVAAMRRAGWSQADPISFRSAIRDAGSVLFARPYEAAPVSTHYVDGRRQDLAFERIVGGSPRRRHHVRFWRTADADGEGRAVWLGAASYDRSVGFSRYTGEVMHHIDPRVDAERETLFADLARAGALGRRSRIEGFRQAGRFRNGGGDPYETDGALAWGELSVGRAAKR